MLDMCVTVALPLIDSRHVAARSAHHSSLTVGHIPPQNGLFSQELADIEDRHTVRAARRLHRAVVAGPSPHERHSER